MGKLIVNGKFYMIKYVWFGSQMRVHAKVFIQPTLSPCAKDAAASIYEEAKRSIEKDYEKVEIEITYWPIDSSEARRLGIYQVGTLLVEEKKVLEGYYTKYDVERELRKYINAKFHVQFFGP